MVAGANVAGLGGGFPFRNLFLNGGSILLKRRKLPFPRRLPYRPIGVPYSPIPAAPRGRWRAAGAGWGLSPAWVAGAVSGHRDGDQGTRRRKGWAAILPVNTCVKTCQGANRSG